MPSGSDLTWYSRESLGFSFQQDGSGNYYAIPLAVFSPEFPTLYKFQVGAGTPGNLLNGYCTDPTTFNLQSMTPTPPSFQPFEDMRVFTTGGVTYIALITESNGGSFYIVNANTMSFVGSYTPGAPQRGWVVFQDNAGDIWGAFQIGNGTGDDVLVKWHPADGATGGVLNFTTPGTGPHTVTQAALGVAGAGFIFATYVPSNNSLWIGASISETGPAANIDLTTFAVTAQHPDDLAYFENGILDNAQSAMDNGVVGNFLAIPADQAGEATQVGGLVNIIDPITNVINTNLNITTAILAHGGLTRHLQHSLVGRITGKYTPHGNAPVERFKIGCRLSVHRQSGLHRQLDFRGTRSCQ